MPLQGSRKKLAANETTDAHPPTWASRSLAGRVLLLLGLRLLALGRFQRVPRLHGHLASRFGKVFAAGGVKHGA